MNLMRPQISHRLDQPITAALRALAMDAVENAKSGHPGAPMGLAEVAAVLWRCHMRHNPKNPAWCDRDRFILSNGHASMLLYALLHLTGYDLPLSELKNFRQLHSKTTGHPEFGVTPGVETTTGPLGQGFANAVGMILPPDLPVVAVEAGATHGWWRYVGRRGAVIGIDRFGESAPAPDLFTHFRITPGRIIDAVRSVIAAIAT